MAVASITFFSTVAVVFGACPRYKFVHAIPQGSCIYVGPIARDTHDVWIEKNFTIAAARCRMLDIGNLKWNLPKLNTDEKLEAVEKILRKFIDEVLPASWHNSLAPGIWLGLHREKAWDKNGVESRWDERFWYWIADDKQMERHENTGINLWHEDQPDDFGGGHGLPERCAMATLRKPDPEKPSKLLFNDTICDLPKDADMLPDGLIDVNVIGHACTADAAHSQGFDWWFYLVCALAVVVPITLTIIVVVCVLKHRRNLKHHDVTEVTSPSRRSRHRGRRLASVNASPRSVRVTIRTQSRRSRQKAKKEEGSQMNADGEKSSLSRAPKIGYVPPVAFCAGKSPMTSMKKSNRDDDSIHPYSNIEFPHRKIRSSRTWRSGNA